MSYPLNNFVTILYGTANRKFKRRNEYIFIDKIAFNCFMLRV